MSWDDPIVDWQPRVVLYDADGNPLRRPAGFRGAEMSSKYHPTTAKPTHKGQPQTNGGRKGKGC